MNTAQLLWGVLFGGIGIGYFTYGRRQRAVVPLLCGLAPMVLPWFITRTGPLVGAGCVIAALPYFIRL